MTRASMLQFLRIQNLALLESIELEFESGFTAVTGETGAGKSILLGALGLLSGARVDKTIIRQGAEACEVEGILHFQTTEAVDALLEASGLPPCEDGQLVLKRTVHRTKAARISVNGSLATLANLQAIGDLWIDFHGPGEPRRLLKTDCQIELLDLFGKLGSTRSQYEKAYDDWRRIEADIERLSHETRLSEEQLDFLREQMARIDSINLDPEAVETLERDSNRLNQAQELAEVGSALSAGLTGDEGVLNAIGPLVRSARQLAELDPSTQAIVDRIESLAVEVEDLGREMEAFTSGLDFDPESAAEIQESMTTLLDLRRRHGHEIESILQARAEIEKRIAEQGDIEGALHRLRGEAKAAEAGCRKLAAQLRVERESAGKSLAKRAEALLGKLGFAKSHLQVALTIEAELSRHGDARPEFLFSPNVGEAPLPLARIASSGELARVMLALKSVLAEVDEIPVLVFDEVDANVGGEIGRVVGERMAAIADRHQVLCVTHLPQVAALARQHLVVEKAQRKGRASVTIRPVHVERDDRVSELARMLGDRSSDSALAHAGKLLGR